jgi:hypothetical protein
MKLHNYTKRSEQKTKQNVRTKKTQHELKNEK